MLVWFFILGSVLFDFVGLVFESLVGCVELVELFGLMVCDVGFLVVDCFWLCGGLLFLFMVCFNEDFVVWCDGYIIMFLECDFV